jgi:ABC-type multidrug transport system fused ATPase/permease subunit
MHALGHALMALVASALALSIASFWGASGLRAPFTTAAAGPAMAGVLDANRAFSLALLGLVVVLVKGLAGVYATYVQVRVAGEIGCALRLDLLDALLCLHRVREPRQPRHEDQGPPFEATPATPGISAAVAKGAPPVHAVVALTDRVRDVEKGLSRGLLASVRAGAQLLPIGVMLFVLSGRMALVAVVGLASFGWVLGRLRARYRAASLGRAREQERLYEAADDSVRHADLWITYGAAPRARATLRRLGEALATGSAWLEARAATMSAANEVLAALALVLAMGAARVGLLGRVASEGTLLAFAVAFFLAYRPLRELAEARLATVRAEAAFAELTAAMEQARLASAEVPAPASRAWPPGCLELRGLRLARGAARPLSMRLEPGMIAVVTGRVGVGKTTLLRTLLGLEPAAGGEVAFAGASLATAPAGPDARPFAWVPQDAPVLGDTLEANVTLGAPGADVHAALEPLGAAHLVASLGRSRLGPGGRVLSGGERQWVALARAIATGQPVLLLDEPTTGLDPEAQKSVLDAIARLRGRRTVILVTHRPEPLAIADVVVGLEEANGVERAA